MANTTYVVKDTKTITAEQQHKCDTCQEPATTGCTDAIEVACTHVPYCGFRHWQSNMPRYGCPAHPVEPKVQYLQPIPESYVNPTKP